MARDPQQYYNVSPIGVWVARLLLIVVLFELLYGVVAVTDFAIYSNADGAFFDPSVELFSAGYLVFSSIAGLGYAGVYFATLIAAAIWIYRVAFNARAAAPGEGAVSPGWAVGWYFIPIMNFWKPYQSMKKVWQVSLGSEGVPRFFGWWWAAWLVTNILGQISFRILGAAQDAEAYAGSAMLDIINVPVGIASAVLFRRIVREVTIAQYGWDTSAGPVARVFE